MILKLGIVVILFLTLLALRLHLSIVVLGSGLLLGILFRMGPAEIIKSALKASTAWPTLKLLLLIYLVLLLVEIQREKNSLGRLLQGISGLSSSKFLLATLSPAIIGLLPMPGGALVSAPMVEESLRGENLSPELKTFVNYWFRHIWEFFWPLYQGFILTVTVFGIKAVDLMKHQFYFTLIALAGGLAVVFPFFSKLSPYRGKGERPIREFLEGTWEILLIILLILFVKLPLIVSVAMVVLFSLVLTIRPSKWTHLFLRAFNYRILLIILSVMIFKGLVEDSSLFPLMKTFLSAHRSWFVFLMVFLPFSIGFLTGVNTAFVGIAFPLFLPMVGKNLDYISLLYISGFSGVLLSPLHLCLVLTCEYFGAKLIRVYKYLLLPVGIILASAVLLFSP